jgi:hypothetical protein
MDLGQEHFEDAESGQLRPEGSITQQVYSEICKCFHSVQIVRDIVQSCPIDIASSHLQGYL